MDKKEIYNLLNSYFDKIYILTIKRSIARQNFIKEYFEGLNYSFFYGVDGKDYTDEEMRKYYDYEECLRSAKRELLKNEIACSMGHKMICEDIINNNYNKALILEDDAILNEKVLDNIDLKKIIEKIPDNYDILYLGYKKISTDINFYTYFKIIFVYPLLNIFMKNRYNIKEIYDSYYKVYNKNIKRLGLASLTHAFCLTKNGAKIVLNEQSPLIKETADTILTNLCKQGKLKGYIIEPEIFIQNENFNSSIWGDR